MNELKNEELLNALDKEGTILSGRVVQIILGIEEFTKEIFITMSIFFAYSKNYSKVEIRFSQVTEFDFLCSRSRTFEIIERYKFFKTDILYFLSLDPYEETQTIDTRDGFFIYAPEISGKLFPKEGNISKK